MTHPARTSGRFLPLLGLAACMTPMVPTSGPISLVDIAPAQTATTQTEHSISATRLRQARDFARLTGGIIEFSSQSAELDAYAQLQLDRQISWMTQNPGTQFDLYGYAEYRGAQPEGAALATRRAQSVKSYMTSHGIADNRLRIMTMDPRDSGAALAGRQAQRRVITELRVTAP